MARPPRLTSHKPELISPKFPSSVGNVDVSELVAKDQAYENWDKWPSSVGIVPKSRPLSAK